MKLMRRINIIIGGCIEGVSETSIHDQIGKNDSSAVKHPVYKLINTYGATRMINNTVNEIIVGF